MMNNNNKKLELIVLILLLLSIYSCRKDNYYVDGGLSQLSEAEFNMTAYDFLAHNIDHKFDSLLKIVDVIGAKSIINQPGITFFVAPNNAVIRFQQGFNPFNRPAARPISMIGKDTLLMLLNRFIIPKTELKLTQTNIDYADYYKDNNNDSLVVHFISGIVTKGSALRSTADKLEYEHRKLPAIDSVNYRSGIQTHNLVLKNAVLHILKEDANFGCGFKVPFYR